MIIGPSDKESDAGGPGPRQACWAPTQVGGNLSGNPGADTRRHRTAPDEIGPASEQPGWSWTGLLKGSGPTRNRKVVGSNPTSGSISVVKGYEAR